MSSNLTVEADRFAYAVDSMLKGVQVGIDESMLPAIKKACRKGVKEEVFYVQAEDLVVTGEYIRGIQYKTKGANHEFMGEIGNKNKPGLAHLLEKGHATGAGARVPGYEHIAPAADETFRVFEETVDQSVDKVLRS